MRFCHYFVKVSIAMFLLTLQTTTIFGQEQKVADSLAKIYKNNKYLSSSEKMDYNMPKSLLHFQNQKKTIYTFIEDTIKKAINTGL
jgi:hypothetical protein